MKMECIKDFPIAFNCYIPKGTIAGNKDETGFLFLALDSFGKNTDFKIYNPEIYSDYFKKQKFVPSSADKFYYISQGLEIFIFEGNTSFLHGKLLSALNYFETTEEAQKCLDKVEAIFAEAKK